MNNEHWNQKNLGWWYHLIPCLEWWYCGTVWNSYDLNDIHNDNDNIMSDMQVSYYMIWDKIKVNWLEYQLDNTDNMYSDLSTLKNVTSVRNMLLKMYTKIPIVIACKSIHMVVKKY